MPGLFELLETIEQRGLPTGVATSTRTKNMKKILDRFQLLDRFHVLLAGEDVQHGKPHPEIYQKAVVALAQPAEQVLALEDSSNGTQAAAQAGTHIVAVPHRFSGSQDFSQARHIATSLLDPYIVKLLN